MGFSGKAAKAVVAASVAAAARARRAAVERNGACMVCLLLRFEV
jgi:hypothetical protein